MTVPPIVLSVPEMAVIAPRRDLVYKTAEGLNLLADLYLPESGRGLYPAVIMIHGGIPPFQAEKPKDWPAFDSWGRLWAASGMAAVAFNHRLTWKGGYDRENLAAAIEDVRDLVRYVRENGATLGVDGDRICLFAFSAGGPALAWAIAESPAYVRCYIGFYPFLDYTGSDPADCGRFSPIAAMEGAAVTPAPFFIARAGLDLPILNEAITRFVATTRRKGATVTLMEHSNGRHGFDTLDDDDTSRSLIREAVGFATRHLVT